MPFPTKQILRPAKVEAPLVPSVRFTYDKPVYMFGENRLKAVVIEDPPKEVKVGVRYRTNIPSGYKNVRYLIRKPWSYFIAILWKNSLSFRSAMIFFSDSRVKSDSTQELLYAPLPNVCYSPLWYYEHVGICMGSIPGSALPSAEEKASRLHEIFWSHSFNDEIRLYRSANPRWMKTTGKQGVLSRMEEWERRTRKGKPMTWNKAHPRCNSIKKSVRWLVANDG